MKTNKVILCTFCIILICIVYNLYINSNESINIENFDSILKDLNKNSKKQKKKNNSNSSDSSNDSNNRLTLDFKQSVKKLKSKKTGITFDDLFKATENMEPEKLSVASMQKELTRYNNSFKKEKFKSNSKSTAEAFEKFSLYKEKFFEIFK